TTRTVRPPTRSASRSPGERVPGASATIGVRGDPDRRDEDATGQGLAVPGQEPGLRPVEGHREVRSDSRIRRVAGSQVDRGRRVDGEDRDHLATGAIDQLDGRPDRVTERPAEAGTQQGVDDDRGLLDAVPED